LIDTVALVELGNDIRVEQEFHSLSFRHCRSRLVEHACKGLIGEIRAEYVESGLHNRIDQRLLQRRSKSLGLLGLAAKCLDNRSNKLDILPRRLNFKAYEPARSRSTPMRFGCQPLGFVCHLPALSELTDFRLYNRND
jgi:hypothetical protein